MSFGSKVLRRFPAFYYPARLLYRQLTVTERNFLRTGIAAVENIIDISPVKSPRPVGALIGITNGCNLDCPMCNTKMSGRKVGLLQPEVFEKIVIELKRQGITSAGLHTVGETFVYKKLDTLLEVCRKHDFGVVIATNGQLTKRIVESYQAFPDLMNHIRISIDAADKETYEAIRRGGTFEQVIETFEALHALNEGKPHSRITVGTCFVLCMSNIHQVKDFIDRFKTYVWPENMLFMPIHGCSPDTTFFWETFPFPNLIRKTVPCHMPFDSIYFNEEGGAALCCRDYKAELVVGDIRENTLDEIWHGPQAEHVRAQHEGKVPLEIEACADCHMQPPFVKVVINSYIQYLYRKAPHLDSRAFGDRLVNLLKAMDTAVGEGGGDRLRAVVRDAFDRAG